MSVWQQGRIPGQARRHSLGLWLASHKLASPAYAPSPRARLGLRYKMPKWYVINVTLDNLGVTSGQTTKYGRVSVAPNFRLMQMMATHTAADPADGNGSFAVEVYDTARRVNFQPRAVASLNFAGTAQRPFILRWPYRFSGTTPVQVRFQNRAAGAGTNVIQLILFGVCD
jgi:hypothetical protein